VTTAVQVVALLLVAVAGTATVFTRDPRRQLVTAGLLGLSLAILFFVFQAPDVALSQVVVGTVAVPAMVLLALTKIEEEQDRS
jgi:energy-converting hydrogenase B subunit D